MHIGTFLLAVLLGSSSQLTVVSGFSSSGDADSDTDNSVRLQLQRVHDVNWVNSVNMSSWYKDWEICLINKNESSIVSNFKHDVLSCLTKNRTRKKKISHVAFRCNVGNTYYSNPCVHGTPTNMQHMTHLSKAIAGHDDPSQRPLYDFYHNLLEKNGSVIIFGDSVMKQFASAMTCELERENLAQPDWAQVAVKAHIPGKGHVKIKWEQHVQINKECLTSLEGWTRWMLQIKDSVVIIINTGIWYNTRREYSEALARLFQLLLKLALVWEHHPREKYLAIVFAETTAQHFHTSNGYYNKEVHRNTSRSMFCKTLPPSGRDESGVDWRNDMLWEHIEGVGGRTLQNLPHVLLDVLPMHSLTHDLADIHLRQGRHDCTHFCYTPMLYQTIYSRLAAMSKTFLTMIRNHVSS